eukprot:4105318-Prymnesium_polylepis.3
MKRTKITFTVTHHKSGTHTWGSLRVWAHPNLSPNPAWRLGGTSAHAQVREEDGETDNVWTRDDKSTGVSGGVML